MLKMIDLTYYANKDINSLEEVWARHITSLGYIEYIKSRTEVQVIKHLAKEEKREIEGIECISFNSNNKLFHVPAKTHAYIKAYNPDIVLVQGLGHPWQLIALRKTLGKKAIIMAQHHGEMPHGRIKMVLQKLSDRYINAYLFTATGNAQPWIERGIIKHLDKCHEVIEASTCLRGQDKQESLRRLSIDGAPIFLCVADLDNNKDPLTVLSAFAKYLILQPSAKLYMIYRGDDLLPQVERMIEDVSIAESVYMIGKVPHDELTYWFSAADYYISGSHKEACGYALLEAMACGCIPIVSNIPPYRKLTNEGEYGILWEKGNADSLYKKLRTLQSIDIENFSSAVSAYALKAHSFQAIANDLYEVCIKLIKAK